MSFVSFKNKRDRNGKSEASLIPLINVVFLLLAFFMIAGHIQQAERNPVDLPDARTNELLPKQRSVLHITAEGDVYFENELVNSRASAIPLEPLLAQVTSLDQTELVVKADASLDAATLLGHLSDLGALGFKSVSLATDRAHSP